MALNQDDSMISGEEFKIRRFAIGLEQPQLMAELDVGRAIIDKWQSGKVRVPKRARELLEMCETDVQSMVDDFVVRRVEDLHVDAPDGWPWGERTWFVVLSRARFAIAELGVPCAIGGRFTPEPPKPRGRKKADD